MAVGGLVVRIATIMSAMPVVRLVSVGASAAARDERLKKGH
jgi:F0F1-type ATP synthase membrane subunit c/vacuolar-type H+-ATPase subunit K